jgi:predicted DNA-binding transcriptional regulator YafY
VRILDTPAKKPDEVRGLEGGLDLPTHMAEHIYMFNGECGMVTFKAKKYIINDIIDWFGTDVSFFKESEDEIRVATRVNYHAMKYWAMQYGYHVTVTSPPTLVEEIKNELNAAAKKYMK